MSNNKKIIFTAKILSYHHLPIELFMAPQIYNLTTEVYTFRTTKHH